MTGSLRSIDRATTVAPSYLGREISDHTIREIKWRHTEMLHQVRSHHQRSTKILIPLSVNNLTGGKVPTTRTGSLEPGLALVGFTTFMVRPWGMIQLVSPKKTTHLLQSSLEGVIPAYILFTTSPISLTNRELRPFGRVRACCGQDFPNAWA